MVGANFKGGFVMAFRGLVGLSLVVAMGLTAFAADALKSGPEVGSNKISAFHPLNVTGNAAGKPQCLV